MSSLYLNILRRVVFSSRNCVNFSTYPSIQGRIVKKEFKTENNLTYLEDPNCFGTLSGQITPREDLEDEGDVKEEQYIKNIPLKSQKLTIKQYADLIKQYVKLKRLKEAFDVLEVRMLKEDRVKPENYIYNILIGACADVGYTKKAFHLYNDMKKRALKPTGDTYTCLFESCINSPWPESSLKNITHLRNLMIEKGIEPNLTNYNVMIKAFGRCRDLPMAFKLVDEMIEKKIKIRVHTFNHLLQACISDKKSGLKHALIVWRKMLKMREKPNIYSFNLMLKCVKDCNLGSREEIQEIMKIFENEIPSGIKLLEEKRAPTVEDSQVKYLTSDIHKENWDDSETCKYLAEKREKPQLNYHNTDGLNSLSSINNETSALECQENHSVAIQLIDKGLKKEIPQRTVPNLLSKVLKMDQVLLLQEVHSPQDKFAVIGGQDDFLKEMEEYSVKPNIKTITQMLPLLDNNTEAEIKLIKTMESFKIKPDIDFYNMLIKKRCLRHDYDAAFDVEKLIKKESRSHYRNPANKKRKLQYNVMTYGVLALACKTKEKAEKLISDMNEKQLRINAEIAGTLLQNAAFEMKFGYVLYVMNLVKQEKINVNHVFLKHLEVFNDKCLNIIEKNAQKNKENQVFELAYQKFSTIYRNWLKEINIEEVLKEEHPWQQFKEPFMQSLQRDPVKIEEPKRFSKRKRGFVVPYKPRV